MAATDLAGRAALVQRDMSKTVGQFRPEKARTLATFEEGTRSKEGRLAGLQIAYWKDHAHGQTWYAPTVGDTSFKKSIKQKSGAMYAGVAFRNMNFFMEEHIMKDMERGYIPDSYIKERRRRISTHMMKKNWAAIGDGTGALANVVSSVGGLLTCSLTNARGLSKGVFRLKISDSEDPLLYDAVNRATDAVVATFYVVSKPTATTANVVFTFGNDAALNVANLAVCESGSWKKEMIGITGHVSDSTSRIYQSADVAVDTFLQNPVVSAGNAAVTPSAIHAAKGIMMTRANSDESDFSFICHLTFNNYRTLAAFGYSLRSYNAEGGKANKTFGVPNVYEDGDTVFVPDADFEEGEMIFRERAPYFEYVQKEFGLKNTGGVSRHEWIGVNQVGSTNAFENYNEAVNIVWDGAGKDGDGKSEGGSPNSAVIINNIALPANNQATVGV